MLSIKVWYFFISTFFVLCVRGAPQDNDIFKFFDRNSTDFNNFKKDLDLYRENARKNDELGDKIFKITNDMDKSNKDGDIDLFRENASKNDELGDIFKITNDMDKFHKDGDIIVLDLQRRLEMKRHRNLDAPALLGMVIWIVFGFFISSIIVGGIWVYNRCCKKMEVGVIHRQNVLVVVVPDENTEQQQPSNDGTALPPCYEEAVTIAPLPTAEELLAKKQSNQNQA